MDPKAQGLKTVLLTSVLTSLSLKVKNIRNTVPDETHSPGCTHPPVHPWEHAGSEALRIAGQANAEAASSSGGALLQPRASVAALVPSPTGGPGLCPCSGLISRSRSRCHSSSAAGDFICP